MRNFVSSGKNLLVDFLGGLAEVVDALASIPGPELKSIVGFVFSALVGFGVLHATNTSGAVDQVYAVLVILLGAGVAIQQALTKKTPPAA